MRSVWFSFARFSAAFLSLGGIEIVAVCYFVVSRYALFLTAEIWIITFQSFLASWYHAFVHTTRFFSSCQLRPIPLPNHPYNRTHLHLTTPHLLLRPPPHPLLILPPLPPRIPKSPPSLSLPPLPAKPTIQSQKSIRIPLTQHRLALSRKLTLSPLSIPANLARPLGCLDGAQGLRRRDDAGGEEDDGEEEFESDVAW